MSPLESLVSAEHSRLLRRAVDALPEREYKVLRMFATGSSYREISTVLNVPIGSVGTILARARDRLQWLESYM